MRIRVLTVTAALVTQRDDFHVYLVTRSGETTDVGVVPTVSSGERPQTPGSEGTGGEGGLMGVAVSPAWDTDHHVYFMHTSPG